VRFVSLLRVAGGLSHECAKPSTPKEGRNVKTVVVTGCSSGVGRAAALMLDRHGWQVFAIVCKESDADALKAQETRIHPLLADVTHRSELFAAAQQVAEIVGENGVDGLICDARRNSSSALLDSSTQHGASIAIHARGFNLVAH
jgi:NAD(P)-dependent dehydrogenase (short-subunit alcohol dehydrogenase family)